jgi:hypothetical protein
MTAPKIPGSTPVAPVDESQNPTTAELPVGPAGPELHGVRIVAGGGAPVEIFVRGVFRDNDDAEALMTLWMRCFVDEKGRPARKHEARAEWERRFRGHDGELVRGKEWFERWWWASPPHLKHEAGRPPGDEV